MQPVDGRRLQWSDEMIKRIDAYADIHERYQKALRERRDLEASKVQTQAAELWGNA